MLWKTNILPVQTGGILSAIGLTKEKPPENLDHTPPIPDMKAEKVDLEKSKYLNLTPEQKSEYWELQNKYVKAKNKMTGTMLIMSY